MASSSSTSFRPQAPPSVTPSDIQQTIALIQSLSAPASSTAVQEIQSTLLSLQRAPAAWSLVLPLLSYTADPNVQFFGAHTAQAKIARGEADAQLPARERNGLRRLLLGVLGARDAVGASVRGTGVVRRKVFGAIAALAVRVCSRDPRLVRAAGEEEGEVDESWDTWITDVVQTLVDAGAPGAQIHEFLAGAAEDVGSAQLLPQPKIRLESTLRRAAPLVLPSVASAISVHLQTPTTPSEELTAALGCFTAWLPTTLLPDSEIAALVPQLILLLSSSNSAVLEAATRTLTDLLSSPPTSWSPSVVLEPLMLWAGRAFEPCLDPRYEVPSYSSYGVSAGDNLPKQTLRLLHTHAGLVISLAESGVEWVAAHIVDASPVSGDQVPRAILAQGLMRMMLALTALDPGGIILLPHAGDDDDGDEGVVAGGPLSFWYLLQEALWEVPVAGHDATPDDREDDELERLRMGGGLGGTPFTPAASRTASFGFSSASDALGSEKGRKAHSTALYVAVVRLLLAKITHPAPGAWDDDQLEVFAVYRRDVGDTLLNAYYILRDDLLVFYVSQVEAGLDSRFASSAGWEPIEAAFYSLSALHEALDTESLTQNPSSAGALALQRLFRESIWGRLPGPASKSVAESRLRRTALGLIDTFASYFATDAGGAALGVVLTYVVAALTGQEVGEEDSVCLSAALALRSLCDANRRALAGQIAAFGQVYARLSVVGDTEKPKILQSIASVIQALPPHEAVDPLEAIVGPAVQGVREAITAGAGTQDDEPRLQAILQLSIIAGIARGLTRADAESFSLDDDEEDTSSSPTPLQLIHAVRSDPRIASLRDAIFECISRTLQLWSTDAEVCAVLGDVVKSITALPADVTLLTLPGPPVLRLVVSVAEQQLSASWLSLAAGLVAAMNPPPAILAARTQPNAEAEECVTAALGVLARAGLRVFEGNGIVDHPDIVQDFFGLMDRIAQDFTASFASLLSTPSTSAPSLFDALIQTTLIGISLPERYSFVGATNFLATLIHRLALFSPISDAMRTVHRHLVLVHGRNVVKVVLEGFAGTAPRSAMNNLLELLGAIVSRWDDALLGAQGGARNWVPQILAAEDFYPASRAGPEAKERFAKVVVSSRSVKKTKEAANQFMMVSRGLEGGLFGYVTQS
ncbi:unnamed protein product [Mycena citricolor]|uniref:Importin-13 n=1 Tax=Mycena citricolor TaxID=2018698 RepID=A0AAD2H901_9AGAR|nr:unnamed protein product [Mycena citricolor]